VVAPPTRSVARVRRAVEAMPAGGGTPMAAGLEAVLRLATAQAGILLVLLTDGRANVPRAGSAVVEDLARACQAVRSAGIAAIVIDTAHRALAGGEALRVAELLGGRYVRFPKLDAPRISSAVLDVLQTLGRTL
jgi:magnesium chelatase subunit D